LDIIKPGDIRREPAAKRRFSAGERRAVEMKKISAVSGFVLAVALLYSYRRGAVPMTEIYVPERDFGYHLSVFLLGFVGAILLAGRLGPSKKTALRVLGLLLFVGLPVLFAVLPPVSPAWDYRPHRIQMAWVGFLPVLAAFLGLLAFRGRKAAPAVLAIVFAAVAVFHAVLSVKLIGRGSGAFSGRTGRELTVALGILVVSAFFSAANYKALARKSSAG
jgi:hypothetical protein